MNGGDPLCLEKEVAIPFTWRGKWQPTSLGGRGGHLLPLVGEVTTRITYRKRWPSSLLARGGDHALLGDHHLDLEEEAAIPFT